MGNLFNKTTERRALTHAWHRIRANGSKSTSSETRSEIARFEQDEVGNINRIQKRLRAGTFEFDPQKGVLKQKRKGKKRGIVMASVHNRVVERALLDRLQADSDFVQSIIRNPFSIGGVPDRSVPHGLKLIEQCMAEGKHFFVRSDISGFFDNIPRDRVLGQIDQHINDDRFMQTLSMATTVVLGNEKLLGEDRKLFPVDDHGVAQGSPLSPLFGNVLLKDFDAAMNGRGVTCVRFIDDFIILSESPANSRKAFENGKKLLAELGLQCHDPFAKKVDVEKTEQGNVASSFVFLGHQIEPGLRQPSRKARKSVLSAVDETLKYGRQGIEDCIELQDSFANRQRYVQTLDIIDRILRGWGNSFAYCNSRDTMEGLDKTIGLKLDAFRDWYSRKLRSMDWKEKRRSGGICLLSDIQQKRLHDVPFIVEGNGKKFRRSINTLNVSTDGSVLTRGKRRGSDQGPGGWGYVVHETGEQASGSVEMTTNNRMELQAVIEVLKSLPIERSLHIHTDSQYVIQCLDGQNPVRTNADLWREYQELSSGRASIKITWVKGHSGDEFNETADKLANQAAKKTRWQPSV